MKRRIILLIAALFAASFLLPVDARPPDVRTVNSIPLLDLNAGFLVVATPTISISATGKTNIGQYFPTGTRAVLVNVFGSDLVFNESSKLSTGTFFIGYKVSSGSNLIWAGFDDSPNFYCAPASANPATITLSCW